MKRIIYTIVGINLIVGLFYYGSTLITYVSLSEIEKIQQYKLYGTPAALAVPLGALLVSFSIIFIYLLVQRLRNKMTNEEHILSLGVGIGSALLVNIALWGIAGFMLPFIRPKTFPICQKNVDHGKTEEINEKKDAKTSLKDKTA